jgi:hypothetical protein
VLYAYAAHNPIVGYTQSMNLHGGRAARVHAPPASAFWMLEFVVTTLMPFTFNDQLVGCFADADVLVLLAERELPQLVRHCEAIGLQFSMFATQWFMCLFVLSFPSETAFRIWDRVLYSGPGAIFEVALRALRCAEKKMLATDRTRSTRCRRSTPSRRPCTTPTCCLPSSSSTRSITRT